MAKTQAGQMVGKCTKAKSGTKAEEAKRLTPKQDVLRELYLLSGNRCAMTGCPSVIVDEKGTVIGQVCHIEAAMPDGARFNKKQDNEQRRALSNLLLMCANHHLQIDSKRHEMDWPLAKVRKLKADHEAKFKAIPGSLSQRFNTIYRDNTDSLVPTAAGKFNRLEKALPASKLDDEDRPKREREVKVFIRNLAKTPHNERDFMLGVIRRALKLNPNASDISVDADDIQSALSIGARKLKKMGDALDNLNVGDLSEVGTMNGDRWHIRVRNPSDYLTWSEISAFCAASGHALDDFVMHLQFGLLDGWPSEDGETSGLP